MDIEYMEIDEGDGSERPGSSHSGFEDEFETTIALLEMEVEPEEFQIEVQHSFEEVEGSKQFSCDLCAKICKSKGGLTKHRRSKHVAELGQDSSSSEDSGLTSEITCSLIRDIGRYLADEKVYKEEHIAEVFKLQPSELFVKVMNELLFKFKRKHNHDRFLKEFYATTNFNWKEYFPPNIDKKVVFLMLIHLPERLIGFLEGQGGQESSNPVPEKDLTISPQEFGPLTYLIGYVIRSLYQKSKNCAKWNSTRNKEIQALMLSMKTDDDNQYISSLSRGGLWSPNSWVTSIAEASELAFRKHTNKNRVVCLPVDKIVDEVLTSSLVKSLWCNIVTNCDAEISKECRVLCLENIVKLFVTVRCFSFSKDIVNKYKLSQHTHRKKALRKDLKKASEQM